MTNSKTKPAGTALLVFHLEVMWCREDQTHRASTRAVQGLSLMARGTARSTFCYTPEMWRQHRRKDTARGGRKSPGHSFVQILCALAVCRTEGTWRLQLSTISCRTEAIQSSFGIGVTGRVYVRNAMTTKRWQKTDTPSTSIRDGEGRSESLRRWGAQTAAPSNVHFRRIKGRG